MYPHRGLVNLPFMLDKMVNIEANGRRIGLQSEEELYSIAPRHTGQPEDTDRGPFEAWRNTNGHLKVESSVMVSDNTWLRERAYVLWDEDRVRSPKDGFGDNPGDQDTYTEQEFEDMLDSFDERAEIWEKGGRGYWSKGDTSRVSWPSKVRKRKRG